MTSQWHEPELRTFWRFVAERHLMFLRRHVWGEPPPWTTDAVLAPILNAWAFTNIYRVLDRTTRYLHAVLRREATGADQRDVLFNVIAFRLFTLPATFEALGGYRRAAAWDAARAQAVLTARRDAGQPVFTNAFKIGPDPGDSDKTVSAVRRITWAAAHIDELAARVFESRLPRVGHEALMQIRGVGPFLAYEVLIDLATATPAWLPPAWMDTFVVPGPGALDGLEALTSASVRPTSAPRLLAELRDRQDEGFAAAGVEHLGPRLTLENVEQAACEFSKLVRIRRGGHGKRRYPPATANRDLSPWADLPAEFRVPPKTPTAEEAAGAGGA